MDAGTPVLLRQILCSWEVGQAGSAYPMDEGDANGESLGNGSGTQALLEECLDIASSVVGNGLHRDGVA